MKENISKNKVWQIIGVAVLCAVCVLGAVFGIVFGMNHSSEDLNVSKDMSNQDNIVVETVQEQGIKLTSATTASDGTTTKTITATVNPTSAAQNVEWTLRWQDEASAWAKGKNVQDYVTYTGDSTITLNCKSPFGERIVVRATSFADNTKYGECMLDYEKRILDFSVEVREKTAGIVSAISFSDKVLEYTFVPSLSLGVGTIDCIPEYTYQFTDEFIAALSDIPEGITSFTPNTSVMSIDRPLNFSKPNFSGNSPTPVGYGQYSFGSSLNQMIQRDPQKAYSLIATVTTSVDKAINAYKGNVLKFTCSYNSSNGNGVTVSKVKEISIGSCDFSSLKVKSVSLSDDSIIF